MWSSWSTGRLSDRWQALLWLSFIRGAELLTRALVCLSSSFSKRRYWRQEEKRELEDVDTVLKGKILLSLGSWGRLLTCSAHLSLVVWSPSWVRVVGLPLLYMVWFYLSDCSPSLLTGRKVCESGNGHRQEWCGFWQWLLSQDSVTLM